MGNDHPSKDVCTQNFTTMLWTRVTGNDKFLLEVASMLSDNTTVSTLLEVSLLSFPFMHIGITINLFLFIIILL
jgi:hypothetical protein